MSESENDKGYRKVVIKGYVDYPVRESVNLLEMAREMQSGRGICTNVDVSEVEEEDLPEGAKNFFWRV